MAGGAGAVVPSGRWCVGLASRNGSTERVGTWLWWMAGVTGIGVLHVVDWQLKWNHSKVVVPLEVGT